MKYLFLLLVCLFSKVAYCQPKIDEISDTSTIVIHATLDFVHGSVSDTKVTNAKKIVDNLTVSLQNEDVVITYELNHKTKCFFEVQLLAINTARGKYPIKPEWYHGDIASHVFPGSDTKKTFRIVNPSGNDNIKWLNGDVEIIIRVINHAFFAFKKDKPLWELDCSAATSQLKFKSFIPEIALGIMGGLTYAYGEIIDEESDQLYTEYKDQDTKTELAEDLYKKANDKHQEAFIIKGTGIAWLIGSAVYAIHRKSQHKQHLNLYDEYRDKFLLQPYHTWGNSFVAPNGEMGLRFTFNF